MENREIALKLVLDAIGEATSISNVADRLRLQKSVYLAQEMGIPLGYGYSWYVKGPYSPALTQDYYNLNASLAAGDDATNDQKLHPELVERAEIVKRLLANPLDANRKPDWFEALCSLHFLMRTSRHDFVAAREKMRKLKPHLDDIVDQAHERLREFQLI